MQSNGASVNVIRHDLGQNFQGHKFKPLISLKRREISQKCVMLLQRLMFAIEWHRCEYCTRDLGLDFQGQRLSRYAFLLLKYCTGSDVPGRFASTRIAPAVELLLFNCIVDMTNQVQYTIMHAKKQ